MRSIQILSSFVKEFLMVCICLFSLSALAESMPDIHWGKGEHSKTYTFTSKAGETVSFHFAVSGYRFEFPLGYSYTGYQFDVYLDDVRYTSFNSYSPSMGSYYDDVSVPINTAGNHSVKLVWNGGSVNSDLTGIGNSSITISNIEIPNSLVTSISLNKSTISLYPSEKFTLTANILPANATNKNVIWKSSNTAVATVNSSGIVTGVKSGTCTITCTAEDGSGVNAKCIVTVTNVLATGITLNKMSVLIDPDKSYQLKATITPANTTDKNVTWKSSNKNIATVDNSGLVTAVQSGDVIITCTAADGSGVSATCALSVSGKPELLKAIDLGLPSGTMWSNINLGAISSYGTGGYYMWGETLPQATQGWKTYKLCNGTNTTITKYCTDSSYGTVDNKTVLEPTDDAARVRWGNEWEMPNNSQLQELKQYCTLEWTARNSHNGYLITGPNGNSIFLPAASNTDNVAGIETRGDYWSKEVVAGWTKAYGTGFNDQGSYNPVSSYERRIGRSIRPVSTTKAIRVSGVSISPASVTLIPGSVKKLTATVLPSDATNKRITWTSSSEAIATVSSSGQVTAVGYGTCIITCTAADGSGKTATCKVIVSGAPSNVEFIDLGLPSGTLWANMNIGATTPEGLGCYFAWGETSVKEEYEWSTYKWCNGTQTTMNKYCVHPEQGAVDYLTELTPEDDAATVNWGNICKMPTRDQLAEILECCDYVSITQNGVPGWIFTGPNGKSIFIPSAGRITATDLGTTEGELWLYSSTLSDANSWAAYCIRPSSGTLILTGGYVRFCGRSVRAVSTSTATRVSNISLIPGNTTMALFDNLRVEVSILPEDATNKSVRWSSLDESVATVNSEGVVKAVGKGTTTITCTALDGSGVSGTMTVTVINEMVINDGEPLDFSDAVLDKLTYNRTMKNKEWQPLYVPFSMSYDDWKNYYDVAQINMMHQYDNDNDGEPDEMELEFFLVTKGALKPNYPYIIRLKNVDDPDVEVSSSNPQTVSLVMEDCSVEATKENTVYCMSMFYEYFFTGTYEGVTNKSGYYAMSSGKLIRASETANLKPQRWYMTIFNRESQLIQPVEHVKVHVFGDTETIEDEATTIDYIESTNAPVHVYDLQGRKVKQHTRPGIYIMNNKKVLVR